MKYEVNNSKVSSLSLTSLWNRQRQRRRLRRTMNIRRVQGIGDNSGDGKDLGMTTYDAASWWWPWGIGDNKRGIGREIWSLGLENDDGRVARGSRRDNAPERTSLAADPAVCLRSQGIDDHNGGIYVGRWARGVSDDDRCVGGGRGTYDVSEGLEKMADIAGAQRRSQRIYNNDGGVGGGIREQIIQQK